MTSPGNQHCASCIGTLSLPTLTVEIGGINTGVSHCARRRPLLLTGRISTVGRRLDSASGWTHSSGAAHARTRRASAISLHAASIHARTHARARLGCDVIDCFRSRDAACITWLELHCCCHVCRLRRHVRMRLDNRSWTTPAAHVGMFSWSL